MKIKDLIPNTKNPRVATSARIDSLKKSAKTFGDISGIVYNKRSKQLVTGHQRVKTFNADTEITITKKYGKPTVVGTVAEGFILSGEEKWAVRIVSWDKGTEKAAMISANRGAGDWDSVLLGELFQELNEESFDLDLTMFDSIEREEFFFTDDEDEAPAKKKSKGKSHIMHTCPECGHEFN